MGFSMRPIKGKVIIRLDPERSPSDVLYIDPTLWDFARTGEIAAVSRTDRHGVQRRWTDLVPGMKVLINWYAPQERVRVGDEQLVIGEPMWPTDAESDLVMAILDGDVDPEAFSAFLRTKAAAGARGNPLPQGGRPT